MKHFFSFLLFLTISISYGQVTADSKLSARFTDSQIINLELSQSKELQFWNFYVDNCYQILDIGEKALEYPNLNTIVAINHVTNLPFDISNENPNLATFNPLKYNVPLSIKDKRIYNIGNSKAIFFLPKKELMNLFNQSL